MDYLFYIPSLFLRLLLSLLLISCNSSSRSVQVSALALGVNYGQIADNLPPHSHAAGLIQSLGIKKVKLYNSDPSVLAAFANYDAEFIVGVGNENIQSMTDATKAKAWLQQDIQPHLSRIEITCITVGNEVLSGNDTSLMSNLLPAMQSLHAALVSLGLDKQISISTAHSLSILSTSYPPSAGSFRPDLAEYIQPLLSFLAQIKSPFLINAYPFFAYKANPSEVSLDYVLFQPNAGMTDPYTNLKYYNMLDAQIDSVYSAIKAMGHTDIELKISETGWPSKGDADEPGATLQNAEIYNRNLVKRTLDRAGTPMNPEVAVEIHVFALFNEDLKRGPTSERNYGLLYPDGTPVYNVGLTGYSTEFSFACRPEASSLLDFIIPVAAFLIDIIL